MSLLIQLPVTFNCYEHLTWLPRQSGHVFTHKIEMWLSGDPYFWGWSPLIIIPEQQNSVHQQYTKHLKKIIEQLFNFREETDNET